MQRSAFLFKDTNKSKETFSQNKNSQALIIKKLREIIKKEISQLL